MGRTVFFLSSRRRHTRCSRDWSSDVCSSDLVAPESMGLAETRKNYGASLVAQEKWSEAIPVYDAMHAGLATDPVSLQRFDQGDINWAYALVRTGQAKPAVVMMRSLVETWRKRVGEN